MMTTPATATLLNLLGYITGAALYAMLLAMALGRAHPTSARDLNHPPLAMDWSDRLPLLTALLGLVWNFGALLGVAVQGFAAGSWRISLLPLLNATAFTALGLLPAVVVHALLRTGDGFTARPTALGLTISAYGLSTIAGALHFQQAVTNRFAPSHWALHTLTIGFIALLVALLLYTRREPGQVGWKSAGWALALAIFAVSALHLSHHEGREFSWWIELIGHHASLPLALAILYQDYRFALADIFLKRALALVLLVGLAFGLYLLIASPLLARGAHDAFAVGLLLGLWVVTALVYPLLRRVVHQFVDAIVLRRADYEVVRAALAQALARHETPDDILNEVCQRLSAALTARRVEWTSLVGEHAQASDQTPMGSLLPQLQLLQPRKTTRRLRPDVLGPPLATALASILVPTTDAPQYRLMISELAGGRRLLSDDLALLETAAVLAARRIDAVRVVHERCVRDLHEEEMHKLATEAELRALRAQLNPHFLFNALTTIGYLIQAAPDRALDTLLRLTTLLRGVLRHADGEFSTLGDEIELIEAYLEIERARFEDRLRVLIDVPDALRGIRIPALLIQPLVENAIKHGISPQRAGGEVVILARLARGDAKHTGAAVSGTTPGENRLQVWVRDTGAGASELALQHGRTRGVGLINVEQRIQRHFGAGGRFTIRSAAGLGTTVEIELPVNAVMATTGATANAAAQPSHPPEARRRQA